METMGTSILYATHFATQGLCRLRKRVRLLSRHWSAMSNIRFLVFWEVEVHPSNGMHGEHMVNLYDESDEIHWNTVFLWRVRKLILHLSFELKRNTKPIKIELLKTFATPFHKFSNQFISITQKFKKDIYFTQKASWAKSLPPTFPLFFRSSVRRSFANTPHSLRPETPQWPPWHLRSRSRPTPGGVFSRRGQLGKNFMDFLMNFSGSSHWVYKTCLPLAPLQGGTPVCRHQLTHVLEADPGTLFGTI